MFSPRYGLLLFVEGGLWRGDGGRIVLGLRGRRGLGGLGADVLGGRWVVGGLMGMGQWGRRCLSLGGLLSLLWLLRLLSKWIVEELNELG